MISSPFYSIENYKIQLFSFWIFLSLRDFSHSFRHGIRRASSLREGAFGRERNIVLFAKGHLFEGAAASAAGGVFAFGMMHNETALKIGDKHNRN